jgi:hypothetical protein
MLNDQAITSALAATITHLESANLDQAGLALKALDFDQLLKHIPNPIKQQQIQFIDPAAQFGVERVQEAGRYIRACQRAIKRGERVRALAEARKAQERWGQV